ncbi:MAG: heme-copper oxidase subunit III [SAR324 cluster bacterium]|nr:heme-copper oxidase subunit III [SAR324 cluster bacterium]
MVNIPQTHPRTRSSTPVPSGVVGVLIFIAAEMMFFSALLSAYYIIRAGSPEWPPWGQPRLPVEATAVNTVILLLSAVVLHFAYRHFKHQNKSRTVQLLTVTVLLGMIFVGMQGYEWVKLISFGLTMTSSAYGGVFYLIIGCHGLHVLGGLMALMQLLFKVRNDVASMHPSFVVPQIFWYFVVALWPLLYVTVYLL